MQLEYSKWQAGSDEQIELLLKMEKAMDGYPDGRVGMEITKIITTILFHS